jgi:hypothetical protein
MFGQWAEPNVMTGQGQLDSTPARPNGKEEIGMLINPTYYASHNFGHRFLVMGC